MKLMLDIDIPRPAKSISYHDHILMIGSCFTGNVGKALSGDRFDVLYNPTGILFDPLSAAMHLKDMMKRKIYTEADLFALNGLWNSWSHHSEFSSLTPGEALSRINTAVSKGAAMLGKSSWLMITLGTSFSYSLVEDGMPVANCHKAPSKMFNKRMLEIDEIVGAFSDLLDLLFESSDKLQVLFTVSPVRHVRDGVVENNRSKARSLEAVHTLVERYDRCSYFPAYELVIDVLRDHRFYDADLVHPNYLATQYVYDRFCESYMDTGTLSLAEEVRKITAAQQHRPQHPSTEQHKQFLSAYLEKVKTLQVKLPMLDWSSELHYFGEKK